MKKALLLPLLCLTGLVGCGSAQVETKPYDTGWVEVDVTNGGYFVVHTGEEVAARTLDQYLKFEYRYCAYPYYAEITLKYTNNTPAKPTATEYYCGANITYHFQQYN